MDVSLPPLAEPIAPGSSHAPAHVVAVAASIGDDLFELDDRDDA